MSLREDSILFLLGAGASVDAGIKHAKAMTVDIEEKIVSDRDFVEFNDLYNYLKSSIIYQRGLEGDFRDQSATIEELLNVLSEIKLKDKNKLYPFIGGWNIHLLKVAGDEFDKVDRLDRNIRNQLFQWINISNYDCSSYFDNLKNLVSDIGSAIKIFTLNYDICVEKSLNRSGIEIELGFNDQREWEASKFDINENSGVDIYLYKLHGSIDWTRDISGALTLCDTPQPNPELIFGTEAKLNSIDPYLFYVHEFRKYSLSEALRFIVVVGYSFSDGYINTLIRQAVSRNSYLKILVVAPTAEADREVYRISQSLNVTVDKILYKNMTAKHFFENNMNLSFFSRYSGVGDDDPF